MGTGASAFDFLLGRGRAPFESLLGRGRAPFESLLGRGRAPFESLLGRGRAPFDLLFRILLSERHEDWLSELRSQMQRESGLRPGSRNSLGRSGSFTAAVEALEPHKVFPLLAYRLRAADALHVLPQEMALRLEQALAEVRALNQLLLLSAASIFRAAASVGTEPVVLKGFLFADAYYPDLATRPMSDLDLLSAPGEAKLLQAALAAAGFSRVPDHVVQAHAVAFESSAGVACDAHTHLEMYPTADFEESTRVFKLRRLRGVRVRALEPNLMLAHLFEHMHGHMHELGLVLLWLCDVAFVLRQHAGEFEADKFLRFLTDTGARTLALRVLSLLERYGVVMPEGFAALRPSMQRVPVLSLMAVLRMRRTLPWGISKPRGLLRLLAHETGLRKYPERAEPSAFDLAWLPYDLWCARPFV